MHKLSGLPKSNVIGSGIYIDSARLKNFIGDLLEVFKTYPIGEHGDV